MNGVGWADSFIPAANDIRYYESVENFTRTHTNMGMDDFYRLFVVPGMTHWCDSLRQHKWLWAMNAGSSCHASNVG